MSLDVYLTRKRDEPTDADKAIALLKENGFDAFAWEIEARHECGDIKLYSANITHNLKVMADEAGICKHLWCPEEIGITKAAGLVSPLKSGLELLRSDAERFKTFNPSNGWGTYEGLVKFVEHYIQACEKHPDADVYASG